MRNKKIKKECTIQDNLENIFLTYVNTHKDEKEAQKSIDLQKYIFKEMHAKGIENTNIEMLLNITIDEVRHFDEIKSSIETRSGIMLAAWGVLFSASAKDIAWVKEWGLTIANLAEDWIDIPILVLGMAWIVFGMMFFYFTYSVMRPYTYEQIDLRNKEKYFKCAVDDKNMLVTILLDSYTYIYTKSMEVTKQKANSYRMQLIMLLLCTVISVIYMYFTK